MKEFTYWYVTAIRDGLVGTEQRVRRMSEKTVAETVAFFKQHGYEVEVRKVSVPMKYRKYMPTSWFVEERVYAY